MNLLGLAIFFFLIGFLAASIAALSFSALATAEGASRLRTPDVARIAEKWNLALATEHDTAF